MTRLAEIRGRLEAATPGPWRGEFDEERWEAEIFSPSSGNLYVLVAPDPLGTPRLSPQDHALIVHAPGDIKYLLDEVQRLNGALRAYYIAEDGPET